MVMVVSAGCLTQTALGINQQLISLIRPHCVGTVLLAAPKARQAFCCRSVTCCSPSWCPGVWCDTAYCNHDRDAMLVVQSLYHSTSLHGSTAATTLCGPCACHTPSWLLLLTAFMPLASGWWNSSASSTPLRHSPISLHHTVPAAGGPSCHSARIGSITVSTMLCLESYHLTAPPKLWAWHAEEQFRPQATCGTVVGVSEPTWLISGVAAACAARVFEW